VFYYCEATKESSWEHPLDSYYRFLYTKLRKMKRHSKHSKGGRGAARPEDMAKDRELVDLLWAMEKEQRASDLLAASDTSSFYESSVSASRPSGSEPSWSASESPADSFDSGQFAALALTAGPGGGLAGLAQLPPEQMPAEVREIAAYLGINLTHLATPVTVQEVREMAEYLGVDAAREGYLLHLVKMALHAPLPKGWDIYKDERGEPFYLNRATRATSYRHPADEYFINKAKQDRARHVRALTEGAAVRDAEPWLDFNDEAGGVFWFNFRTNQTSRTAPARFAWLDDASSPAQERGRAPAPAPGAHAPAAAPPAQRPGRPAPSPPELRADRGDSGSNSPTLEPLRGATPRATPPRLTPRAPAGGAPAAPAGGSPRAPAAPGGGDKVPLKPLPPSHSPRAPVPPSHSPRAPGASAAGGAAPGASAAVGAAPLKPTPPRAPPPQGARGGRLPVANSAGGPTPPQETLPRMAPTPPQGTLPREHDGAAGVGAGAVAPPGAAHKLRAQLQAAPNGFNEKRRGTLAGVER
jgi:hypothetical protein